MGLVDAIWLFIASACFTLAAIHLHAGLGRREAVGNLAFAMLAASVAAIAMFELGMLRADSPEAFGRSLWWYQWPVWSGMVALVVFVWHHLQTGRRWLGWTVIGLRTVTAVINAFSDPNVNFTAIESIVPTALFGERVAVAIGPPGAWLPLAHLSLVALIAFVADATVTLWRQRRRDASMLLGACLLVFVSAASTVVVLSFWGLMRIPPIITLFFVPIVVTTGFQLSREMIRASALADELVRKDRALRQSQRRLELAAEAANAGLWGIERASGRLWATPRALASFGLAAEGDYRMDDVLAAIVPEDRERVRGALQDTLAGGAVRAVEYRVEGVSGDLRWFVFFGSAGDGAVDGFDGVTGVTLDITERKRTEEETSRYRMELEHLARVATLNELSGTLAHEINQPLATIMSNAEAAQRMLARGQIDLCEFDEILRDIVEADERAGAVIERLRNLLRRGPGKPQTVVVEDLALGVLRFLRADLAGRSVIAHVETSGEPLVVEVDRVAMEQVLINLVTNACDALAFRAPEDRRVCIRLRGVGPRVELSVEDNGSGLPAPPEQVFAPFYTTRPDGLGLGLPIARSIVESHGGRLRAESFAPTGAAFVIELPRANTRG